MLRINPYPRILITPEILVLQGIPSGAENSVCIYLISKSGSRSRQLVMNDVGACGRKAQIALIIPLPPFLLCPRHYPRRPATPPPPRTAPWTAHHLTRARMTLGVALNQCSSLLRSLPARPAPQAFPCLFRSGPAPQICPPTLTGRSPPATSLLRTARPPRAQRHHRRVAAPHQVPRDPL